VGCPTDSEFSRWAWLNTPCEQGGLPWTLSHRLRWHRFHQVVNDRPLGRTIRECLRVIDALQHFEEQGEVCPMDWQKSEKAMTADHQGVSDYLSNK
jgi:peroxiredoxin (alkyl hydroperoxide reductase subunit C)